MRRLVVALLCAAAPLGAQGYKFAPRVQPEVRIDAIAARYGAVLGMAGANVPMGYYVRAGVAAGAGAADTGDGIALAMRADFAVRFLLDPFAEYRWGPYAGGGLTVRRDGDHRAAAGLLFVLGVEGRRGRRWTPAVELALGEGTRLAFVLRRSRKNGR